MGFGESGNALTAILNVAGDHLFVHEPPPAGASCGRRPRGVHRYERRRREVRDQLTHRLIGALLRRSEGASLVVGFDFTLR
jgi:hypothetical protein